ncbi:hypothetical protein MGYG_09150 [Nannizzia gypsea CBS 118893]|uniref:Uncharacterized protein n=1 Tax=Arthroderma gypseum (strain ATCC MYA-4604 / CBS 118893) TaxID=535722 RepID=E4V306_ARTGP|nr:hypothetical protein MGYG_09150 [Nannizzia gypsea CBS 118893]EFR04380.1 hypothetical protein MGYG_09150 [Nannizzia gypsea CBS 118893]
MRIISLAVLLCAFAASTFAAQYYITTPAGLYLNNYGGGVVGREERQNWTVSQVSPDYGKNWHVIHQGSWYLNVIAYREGFYADYSQIPTIYRLEEEGEYHYIVTIGNSAADGNFTWTTQDYSPTFTQLRLRPYTRAPNQRFRFTKIAD